MTHYGKDHLKLVGLVLFVLAASVALTACTDVAAQPTPELATVLEVQELRVGAVCNGPTDMAGCVVSVYDSTASIALATNVAVTKGDTLWRTRACLAVETVTIGATFVGVAPGLNNSDPIAVSGTGNCSPTAGTPTPELIVQVVN